MIATKKIITKHAFECKYINVFDIPKNLKLKLPIIKM